MKIRQYTLLHTSGKFFFGEELLATAEAPGDLESLYSKLGINYPKFFKMGPLAKLGILLSEELMKTGSEDLSHTAIFGWNRYASFREDIKHKENIEAAISGPANFVYTLPNIACGEIAIRYGIRGENGFFIAETLKADEMEEMLSLLFESTNTQRVIAGWMDAGPDGTQGFLCDIVQEEEMFFRSKLQKIMEFLLL